MLQKRWFVWLAIIIFPPLGLVLWWKRGGMGLLARVAGTVGILLLAVIELFVIYGMRLEWTGNLNFTRVSFETRARQDARLEADRARQRVEPLRLVPEPQPEPPKVTGVAVAAPAGVHTAPPPRPSYWTDFRGPDRAGVYTETEINADWPAAGLPLLWKQPVGGGYASFTVAEGRAFTIEQRRDREAITAYDVESGRELWAFDYPALFDEVLGGAGPRATPVYSDGLLYSLGALGDLYCLSARNGKPKWSKNILTDNGAQNAHWGMAGSPLLVEDKVIVTPGGSKGASIVAYDRLTGAPLWHSLNDPAGYTSPLLATLAGRKQIVWISGERAVGITPDKGELLWQFLFPAQMEMNCSQPVVIDDSHVLLSSSQGPGAALLEISKAGEGYAARPVWQNNRLKNKFNSSVLYDGYVYGLDETILACLDPKTGEVKWKGGRYGYGQVLRAGAYLVVLTEQGDLALVRATPEGHHELARFSAIEGRTWNIPAIDHGLLLVRNAREMACFRLSPAAQ